MATKYPKKRIGKGEAFLRFLRKGGSQRKASRATSSGGDYTVYGSNKSKARPKRKRK